MRHRSSYTTLASAEQSVKDSYDRQYDEDVDEVANHGAEANVAYQPTDDEQYDDDVEETVHGEGVSRK